MTTGTMDNVALVRGLYEAFARRDLDAIRAVLAPDVVVEQTSALPWGGRRVGVEGFEAFIGSLLSHLDTTLEIGEFLDAGDHVVEIGHTRGRVLASGTGFRLREVHVWGVRDGKVVSYRAYVDAPGMLAALAGQTGEAAES